MNPVIIKPVPCGRKMHNKWGHYVWTCGDHEGRLICERCTPLGDRLAGALYMYHEFSDAHFATLAANLAIASLLCSAEARGVEQERRRRLEREALRTERAST